MIERRLTKRLMDYWERLRQGREIPPIDAFNPHVVEDLWSNCFKVSVEQSSGKAHYTYRYVGPNVATIFGNSILNQQVTPNMPFLPAKQLITAMNDLLIHPAPLLHNGQFIDSSSQLIKYRSCILPFGTDKAHITHFIAGLSWIAFK